MKRPCPGVRKHVRKERRINTSDRYDAKPRVDDSEKERGGDLLPKGMISCTAFSQRSLRRDPSASLSVPPLGRR